MGSFVPFGVKFLILPAVHVVPYIRPAVVVMRLGFGLGARNITVFHNPKIYLMNVSCY